MTSQQVPASDVRVRVRNVGGIDDAEVTLPPGVTVLSGRNATNRTSFLQAIMAGLGSERPSLKADADEGSVDLEIGEETYTRTLTRRGDSVVFGGDPYLDDSQLADLFAFLLENNEARQAVARGEDLREIIMRPIDTNQIEAEIGSLEEEKREVDGRIETLERKVNQLPDLEAERKGIEDDLEAARAELAELETAIEERDVTLEESRSQKEEIEAAFERLREAQSELEDRQFDLEAERATLSELEDERDELEATLAETDDGETEPERLSARIEELRRRQRSLDDTLSQLGSVISFNEEMLEGDGFDVDDIGTDGGTAGLTEQLVDTDDTVCWTCGSNVERDRIEDTLDRLRDLRKDKLNERNELRNRIEDLTEKRSTIQNRQRERQRTERRLEEIDGDIEATEARIADLEDAVEEQRSVVERLDAETEDVGDDDYDEVLDLHRQANELELRIERLESDLADVESRIEDREAVTTEREELLARREEIADELTELRTRVDRIEADAVESFNDHMASVLDILEYDNIDRVWIERREREVREGRRKVTRSTFDLHIIRTSEEGSSYRDTVDHLSESEREVIGLVFALAGYLVHEVYEKVPFMILDSLEAIDSARIARVVEYFSDHVDYLVVALLPEDAQALSSGHAYVSEIN